VRVAWCAARPASPEAMPVRVIETPSLLPKRLRTSTMTPDERVRPALYQLYTLVGVQPEDQAERTTPPRCHTDTNDAPSIRHRRHPRPRRDRSTPPPPATVAASTPTADDRGRADSPARGCEQTGTQPSKSWLGLAGIQGPVLRHGRRTFAADNTGHRSPGPSNGDPRRHTLTADHRPAQQGWYPRRRVIPRALLSAASDARVGPVPLPERHRRRRPRPAPSQVPASSAATPPAVPPGRSR
jgi:hypothetical protein